MHTNSLTITYLSKVSFASLNGGDKEVDNINPIKKITLNNGEELPYLSSQAIRRALRDKLEELGYELSPVGESSTQKGAPKTALNPTKYIDDDLFGYMDAKKTEEGDNATATRTSPIRVEALLALTTYKGDLDYATNFMGKKIELNANIFESEIHSGVYRGTILIELDRVGKQTTYNKKTKELKTTDLVPNNEKAKRVTTFLDAFRTLWSTGRQTRFLADISPKFIAAALTKSKNPLFLEAVDLATNGQLDMQKLNSVVTDYSKFVDQHVFAAQEAIFDKQEGMVSLQEGFDAIEKWVTDYYNNQK